MIDKQKIRWLQGLSKTFLTQAFLLQKKNWTTQIAYIKLIHGNCNITLRNDSQWWCSVLDKSIAAKDLF